MQYFIDQNFDIAIVMTNVFPDGILMARALEIPYMIYTETWRYQMPVMFNEPCQSTNERPRND